MAVLFLWSRPCLWRVDRGGSFQGVPQMRDTLFEVPAACTDCGRKTDPFNGCRWCSESSDGTESARKASAASVDADPEFARMAAKALAEVRHLAMVNGNGELSIIGVRNVLEGWGVEITRPQALGSVMTAAASAGLIRKTNRTFPSPIKGQHGRDIRVWEVA